MLELTYTSDKASGAHHARLQGKVGHEQRLPRAAAAYKRITRRAFNLGLEVNIVGHCHHGARLRLDGVPRHHRTLHRCVCACIRAHYELSTCPGIVLGRSAAPAPRPVTWSRVRPCKLMDSRYTLNECHLFHVLEVPAEEIKVTRSSEGLWLIGTAQEA